MARKLKDNLSSRYMEAANRLNSKRARRKVIAYVESYDDVFFWRTVLGRLENDRLYFEIMLPTREKWLERGKKAVLMSALAGKTGSNIIACVDADYDYLVQGATAASRAILGNPFVFHTYAYAIENLQCYAPSLHEVCVGVTLNDHEIFDMDDFLRQFSAAIYPLFVWNIWYYRRPDYGRFTMTDFLRTIEMGNLSIEHAYDSLERLRRKVGRKVHQLQQDNPGAKESYLALKKELRDLGVEPENTYLYIQGHHLFDHVVTPLLGCICDRLVRERQNEIGRQSKHNTQRQNELSCYNGSLSNITTVLKKNSGGMQAPQFQHIVDDISRSLNLNKETINQP